MKLTDFSKVRYSTLEHRVFATLPKNGRKVSSKDLADARAKLGDWNVKHPLNIITVVMSNLMRKTKKNREPFVIRKDGKRPGHPEVEFWIESK